MKAETLLVTILLGLQSCNAVRVNDRMIHEEFRFVADDGRTIIVNFPAARLVGVDGVVTALTNCSNDYQTCAYDNRGFAFSFPKQCDMALFSEASPLRYKPLVLSVVHDDSWVVFDSSPQYLFHYVDRKGVVGILLGREKHVDFRTLLRSNNIDLGSATYVELKAMSSKNMAACR